MRRHESTFALGSLVALLALSAGCASVVPTTSAAGELGLPGWVQVVPPPGPDRAFYVGGCAAAPDSAKGISEAMADARAQAGRVARERITPLVDESFRRAGVETEALDRARFRQFVIEPVVERLAGALRRERVFFRECAARPGIAAAGVCDIFVLMTVDTSAWERLPTEVLADLRKQKQSEGRDVESVELLDWILRQYSETDPGVQPGGRGSEGP